jgi:hypothetical protein
MLNPFDAPFCPIWWVTYYPEGEPPEIAACEDRRVAEDWLESWHNSWRGHGAVLYPNGHIRVVN